jgi:hypothetical protein
MSVEQRCDLLGVLALFAFLATHIDFGEGGIEASGMDEAEVATGQRAPPSWIVRPWSDSREES